MIQNPDPIDVHVGRQMTPARHRAGPSQSKVSEGLGISFQQVQKYEKGANRTGAGRRYRVSAVLGVLVTFFYEDLPGSITVARARRSPEASKGPEPLHGRSVIALTRAFQTISDGGVRTRVVELVRAIGRSSP